MSKSTTEVDRYEFKLVDELKAMAESELRETCATRDFALKALREWIEANPRILAARMAKKFSVPITKEAIERYMLLRQSHEFFTNLDMNLPSIKSLFDLGYIFALPKRDKFGRRVIFVRPGVFDPYKYANVDMLKIHGLVYETLMENEENQIRGYVHIVDATGVNLPYLSLFTPKEAVRIIKNAENTLPMRHKEISAIKMHPSVKFGADFALGLVTEKMRNRIKFFTTLESAKSIDKSLLPLEYGGTMPMAEMIDLWKAELVAHQPILLRNDQMRVNLEMFSSKAREGAISALKQWNCSANEGDSSADSTLYGLQGSFRKLEVD